MTESLASKASLDLLNELIIADVNIELMAELGHDGFHSLVIAGKGSVVIIVISTRFEQGIVIVTLLVVAMVERWGGRAVFHSSGYGWVTRVVARWWWHHVGIGIGTRWTWRWSCLQRMVGLGLEWWSSRWQQWWQALAALLFLVSGRCRFLHWLVRRSGRRCRNLSTKCRIFLYNIMKFSKRNLHRLIRQRHLTLFLILLLLSTTIFRNSTRLPTKPTHERKRGNLNLQIPLDHTRRIARRSRRRIVKLQRRPNKRHGRNNTQQSKVRHDILLRGNQHAAEHEGASDAELVAVQCHSGGHGAFVLGEPRCRQ
mmetsp:Transcript_32386/g.68124  ORF Transcript_32386/g.68124 Transcript_32386/m.68124 type:complete len:312 (-) Transcript_32386:439-1374(-)